MRALNELPARRSFDSIQYMETAANIAGPDYTRFLDQALATFVYFSVVWRDATGFDETAFQLRRELDRHETNRRRVGHWPGTFISANAPQATLISYRLDAAARQILARPESLFAWQAPAYPEDLAFYLRDGRLGFATCTQDHLAWALDLTFGAFLREHLKFTRERVAAAGFAGFDYAV